MNRKLLSDLAKDDKKWRKIAYYVCKDYDKAQDLVQDMYIKFSGDNYDSYEKVSTFLASLTIKNIWLDSIKSTKNKNTVRMPDYFEVEDVLSNFEVEDEHLKYLERFDRLPMRQQEFILESYDFSLREIAKKFNIHYSYVNTQIHEGLRYVLGEDYHKYSNSKNKNKKK